MGFYGNITNTGRTHFQFDKIFENRRAMDLACLSGTDDIFAGRFVLVSYDPESRFTAGDILSGFYGSDGKIYADASHTILFYYTNFQQVQPSMVNANNWNSYYWRYENYYIKLPAESYYNQEDAAAGNYYTPTAENANDENKCYVTQNQLIRIYTSENSPTEAFFKCLPGENDAEATWETLILSEFYPDYLINYNIDKEFYGVDQALRGYDGTVWQKIYSEGKGKFILIARLNSLMPGLELFPDAPSVLPSAPYIDSKSSEALYRIHVPSHWGFRIKEANVEEGPNGAYIYPLSDQKITQTYAHYNNNNELVNTSEEEINADIYFNKKANNKLYNYYDDEIDNQIQITPTGASGKIYFDKDGNQVLVDTYELSVHLPMVGNMIADGYNLIYGSHEEPDEETGLTMRTTDVEWYPGNATDELKQNGNSALGGKTHELTTLAGSLNTIHDIMGQIVIDLESWPDEAQINTLSSQYLYRFAGKYYRRGYIFDKTIILDSAYTYIQQSNVTEAQFVSNKYYYKNNNTYIQADSYNANYGASGYYLRNINSVRYTPITLIQFESATYYLLEGENYLCDNSQDYPLYPDRTYYTITDDGGKYFTGQYVSNGTFFTLEDGDYIPSTTTEPLINTTYYTITATPRVSGRFYHPGSYYYKEGNNFILATEDNYDPTKTYYVLIFDDTPKYGYNSLGEVVQYYEVIDYEEDIIFSSPGGYSLNSLYVLEDGKYIPYQNIQNLKPLTNRDPYTVVRQYYTLNVVSYPSGTLYLPGVYYIKDLNSNYTKSYEDLDRAVKYYLIIDVNEVEHPFYVPDVYYWRPQTDVYTLSEANRMTTGRQYYEKSAMYVENDTTGQCPYGYEWNNYAAYVPPSITLYTAEKKPGLIAIAELGKDTNSLYGLLLQLNKMYGPGEEATRDLNTVRGAYNSLRDMLYQVKSLRPYQILYVNDFGQIESISLSDLKAMLNSTS